MTIKEELAHIEAELSRLERAKRELYARSVESPDHEKLCTDYVARLLAEPSLFTQLGYPVEVTGIEFTGQFGIYNGYPGRSLVRIRPCAAEYEGKTFLGLYVGDIARTMGVSYNRETGVLEVFLSHHNPGIWIPSRQRIVFGFESWWGPIESEAQLKEISADEINSVWYVQALMALHGRKVENVEG